MANFGIRFCHQTSPYGFLYRVPRVLREMKNYEWGNTSVSPVWHIMNSLTMKSSCIGHSYECIMERGWDQERERERGETDRSSEMEKIYEWGNTTMWHTMSSLTTGFPYREPLRTDTVIILLCVRVMHIVCLMINSACVVINGKGRKKKAHS